MLCQIDDNQETFTGALDKWVIFSLNNNVSVSTLFLLAQLHLFVLLKFADLNVDFDN